MSINEKNANVVCLIHEILGAKYNKMSSCISDESQKALDTLKGKYPNLNDQESLDFKKNAAAIEAQFSKTNDDIGLKIMSLDEKIDKFLNGLEKVVDNYSLLEFVASESDGLFKDIKNIKDFEDTKGNFDVDKTNPADYQKACDLLIENILEATNKNTDYKFEEADLQELRKIIDEEKANQQNTAEIMKVVQSELEKIMGVILGGVWEKTQNYVQNYVKNEQEKWNKPWLASYQKLIINIGVYQSSNASIDIIKAELKAYCKKNNIIGSTKDDIEKLADLKTLPDVLKEIEAALDLQFKTSEIEEQNKLVAAQQIERVSILGFNSQINKAMKDAEKAAEQSFDKETVVKMFKKELLTSICKEILTVSLDSEENLPELGIELIQEPGQSSKNYVNNVTEELMKTDDIDKIIAKLKDINGKRKNCDKASSVSLFIQDYQQTLITIGMSAAVGGIAYVLYSNRDKITEYSSDYSGPTFSSIASAGSSIASAGYFMGVAGATSLISGLYSATKNAAVVLAGNYLKDSIPAASTRISSSISHTFFAKPAEQQPTGQSPQANVSQKDEAEAEVKKSPGN